MSKEQSRLTITVEFEKGNGLEMENNLNKAIEELGSVLKKKGLIEMELSGIYSPTCDGKDGEIKEIYKVTIKPPTNE